MSCQAEGETAWACTQVLNQAVSSPTTPQIAHVGEKNREMWLPQEHDLFKCHKSLFKKNLSLFLPILVRNSG
jgi:hypothetical protein